MIGTRDERLREDIILQARSNGLQRIRETHNPLRYPLLCISIRRARMVYKRIYAHSIHPQFYEKLY